MQVNLNWDRVTDGYATRDITSVNVEEFNEMFLCLKYRLEGLEEKLEEYKATDNTRLKEYIPKKEKEIEQVKRLINLMQ